MLRLFVALSLPEAVRVHLHSLAGRLTAARWLDRDSYHITLRFIGEVDGGLADDIAHELAGLDGRAFQLSLAGLDHFGEGSRARALWARVEKTEPLLRLQQKVEQALQRAGCKPERRRFTPHVTLARLYRTPPDALYSFILKHSLLRLGPFPVEDFVLYRSFLRSEGALYRAEAVYPLAA
ncbi:MAG: RNA 2',3'-cyclic phosphodiesterase [Rhodospirillales bacterium]|nr:RNA 2',3'-cyclic phosphodiesterase [Rhodospirillales bacterium]